MGHHNGEAELIANSSLVFCYIRLPPFWKVIEIPSGAWGPPMPPIMTYMLDELMSDTKSPMWTVFRTEWAVQVAAWWLWEVYTGFKL